MKKQLFITMLLSMSACSAWGMEEDQIDKKLVEEKTFVTESSALDTICNHNDNEKYFSKKELLEYLKELKSEGSNKSEKNFTVEEIQKKCGIENVSTREAFYLDLIASLYNKQGKVSCDCKISELNPIAKVISEGFRFDTVKKLMNGDFLGEGFRTNSFYLIFGGRTENYEKVEDCKELTEEERRNIMDALFIEKLHKFKKEGKTKKVDEIEKGISKGIYSIYDPRDASFWTKEEVDSESDKDEETLKIAESDSEITENYNSQSSCVIL